MTVADGFNSPAVILRLGAQLLRAGISYPVACLSTSAREDGAAEWFVLEHGDEFVDTTEETAQAAEVSLLVRLAPTNPPAWQQLFRGLGAPPFQELDQRLSAGAVLFVRSNGRLVAWTFGTGSRWVSRRAVDPRFGLLVALNALATEGAVGGGLLAAHLTPNEGGLRDAELRVGAPTRRPIARHDVTSDRLTAVVAETGHAQLARVQGGRSAHFSGAISALDDFRQLSEELVQFRNLDAYKDAFSYVENVVEEDDPDTIDAVLNAVWGHSAPDSLTLDVELAWWDDVRDEPEDRVVTHFRTPREPRNTAVPPDQRSRSLVLTWQGVRAALASKFPGLPPALILSKELRFFDAADEQLGACEVRDLLVVELMVDGVQFVVSDGDVYRVTAEYLDTLNTFLDGLVVRPSRLTPYGGGHEDAYNLAAGLPVLDRQFLTIEGSRLELCDLIDADGRMIFVKLRKRASVMSHLWAQVVSSSVLLRRFPKAREYAINRLEAIDGVSPELIDAIRRGANNLTVVLAILGAIDIRQLTLLARIPLRAAVQRLQDLGYTVEIDLVPGPGQQPGQGGPG